MHPSKPSSSADRPRLRLWGWPFALGALTGTGLASALVSDAWGDWWSWIALGIPTAVMGWYGLRRAPASRPPGDDRAGTRRLPC
ncbi:MAG: hypothetical protein ACO1PB_00320 [Ramlibacter sp.]